MNSLLIMLASIVLQNIAVHFLLIALILIFNVSILFPITNRNGFYQIRTYKLSIDPATNPRLFKSQRTSIASYFLHLGGPVKSRLIKEGQMTPVSQLALTFNWFLQKMVPLKKVGIEETFENLFVQVPSRFYPNFVRRTFSKDRRRKSDALMKFKNDLRPFYDEIYGPFRYFDIIPDAVLGHKVIIHQNFLKHYGLKRSEINPFHAVSENLLCSLFACPQSYLLTKFSQYSLYEFYIN